MAEVQTHQVAGEMTHVFIEFVMMQAQNAALFLGQIPNPRGQEVEVNLPLAKMFIDQLIAIRAKTRGNLNSEEQKVIDSAVRELGYGYAEVSQLLRAQNLGAELPGPLLTVDETPAAAAEPATLQAAPPPAAPAAAPAPAAPASAPAATPAGGQASPSAPAPAPSEPAPEEGRKRFTKSYGS